jgi:TPR repeat protein
MRSRLLITIVAGAALIAPAAVAGPLTDRCSAEAASPYETGFEDTGKLQYEVDVDAALAACEAAFATEPSTAVEAWLSRALRIAGRSAEALERARGPAEAGNLLAMQNVGDIMSDGVVEGTVPTEGFAWLERAAALGFPPAINSLGFSYANGRGVAMDEVRGLALYKEAADKGYGLGAANTGLFYQQGKGGVAVDLEEAVVWFRRAADLGDAMGLFYLGSSLYYGNGVAQDIGAALPLLERAAAQNYPDAIGAMAHAYQFGDGVAEDDAKALALYTEAWDKGVIWTASYIGGLHLEGHGNPAEARRWIDVGLLHDHPYAMYLMGRLYEDGLGVEPNMPLAQTWYDKAYSAGVFEADALARVTPAN